MGRARSRRAAGLVVAALLLTACSGGPPAAAPTPSSSRLASDCRATVDTLLATTERYLDSVSRTSAPAATAAPAAPTASGAAGMPSAATGSGGEAAATPSADPSLEAQRFTTALQDVRSYAARLGCDPQRFRDDLVTGMRNLHTGGPVARAVLLQLQAQTAGTPAPTSVAPGGDLAGAVAAAAPGAAIALAPGTYELSDTLVLLRGVTLRGAGPDTTTVRSASGDGVVLALTGDPVELDGIALAHTGTGAASVLSASPSATLTLRAVRVTGGRSDGSGAGGVGVLMAAGSLGQTGPSRRTSLRMTDSAASDNAVAGVVVAGEHRADITGLTVERSGQCGVCFLGTSDGTLRNSRLSANAAGLVAAGSAKPVVDRVGVDGGEVGIEAIDHAAPAVDGATVTGSARAAFLFSDQATGSVRRSSCDRVPFGIVVTPQAAPDVQDDRCPLARGR